MDTEIKIKQLKDKLHKLTFSEKENAGVQRKLRREIRNLEKVLAQDSAKTELSRK